MPTKALNEAVRFLRTERIGGLILLAATALALIVANSPLQDAYHRLARTVIGPAALHLDLTVERWGTDGLLAFFFVVAGLELKRELVLGELRDPRRAMLPVFGAVGGIVAPALVVLAVAAGSPGLGDSWAVPVATDIAFALGVLAVAARDLPSGLRVFLLTMAIVDDLGAIVLIAVLFSGHIKPVALLGALAAIGLYWLLQRQRLRGRWAAWALYVPLAVTAWGLMHASGVHATIAGVLVGLATRVRRAGGEEESPAEVLEHKLQPFSAGVCVPLFAFFAAGVSLSAGALADTITDRVAVAVVAGLVVGKTIGVLGGAALSVRLRLARLPRDLGWRDMAAVSVLTGCGFTVSLLIAELATGGRPVERIKLAVLIGSLVASVLGALLLRRQARLRAPYAESHERAAR